MEPMIVAIIYGTWVILGIPGYIFACSTPSVSICMHDRPFLSIVFGMIVGGPVFSLVTYAYYCNMINDGCKLKLQFIPSVVGEPGNNWVPVTLRDITMNDLRTIYAHKTGRISVLPARDSKGRMIPRINLWFENDADVVLLGTTIAQGLHLEEDSDRVDCDCES